MNLIQTDITLFYKLWYGLVWSVNEKHKVIPHFKKPVYGTRVTVSVEEFVKVRNAMWDNPQWIDAFLDDQHQDELTAEERDIIIKWRKHFIKDKFLIVKHLAKYSVLMTFEESKPQLLYGVCGITDPVKAAIPYPVPFPVELVLIPFKGKIIYDSLAASFPVQFGSGIRSALNKLYNEIKETHGIIEVLNDEMPDSTTTTKRPKLKIVKSSKLSNKIASVPKAVEAKYNEIAEMITQFCDEKLSEEYKDLSLRALERLCRKRPSPLEKGKARTWACGIVYAIGSNNFIFDKSQPYYMPATAIAEWFGISKSTAGNKASEVTDILDLSYMNTEFVLKSLLDSNPVVWLLEVDGLLVDIRKMPREVQEQAFLQGLIPYIPADEE